MIYVYSQSTTNTIERNSKGPVSILKFTQDQRALQIIKIM